MDSFWYEPATFKAVYKVLRSDIFKMSHEDALAMMQRCFAEENDGNLASHKMHRTAIESYKRFLDPLDYVNEENKNLNIMQESSFDRYLAVNRRALSSFSGDVV